MARAPLQALAAHVRSAARAPRGAEPKTHAVYFVPRRTVVCERVLEEEGVLGEVSVEELPIDWIPFEEDVLSLELGASFKECAVEGDRTSIFYVARALTRLQREVGLVPHIKGVGVGAKHCAEILSRMRKELGERGPKWAPTGSDRGVPAPAQGGPEGASGSADSAGGAAAQAHRRIDALVLVDREVDCVTPLLTPLTYEGLIDHFFGVKNGVVELPAGVMDKGKGKPKAGEASSSASGAGGAPAPASRPARVALNSSDALFKQLRDRNFGQVMAELRVRANAIRADYDSARDSSAHMSQIRDFVKDLKTLPEIERHIAISDALNKLASKAAFRRHLEAEAALVEAAGGAAVDAACVLAEEAAFSGAPLVESLRPLCMASLIAGGLSKRQLDSYRTVLLHAYGHEQLLTLDALLAAGLLRRYEGGRAPFAACRRPLALCVDELDNDNPADVAYCFATQGYAPLSIRLVEHALLRPEVGGWRAAECRDALRALPGPHFELRQGFDANGVPLETADEGGGGRSSAAGAGGASKPLALVVFLGGVTFAEVAALRFLSVRSGYDFLIAATEITSGQRLIESVVPTHACAALAISVK